MARYDDEWSDYVPVAERRLAAAREAEKLRRKGRNVAPVRIEGRAIASTVWGKAWCENLESCRDYETRLPRGRTYVRRGSVIDLQIGPREVKALVSGSSIYTVKVAVASVPAAQWRAICTDCAGRIDSLVELLQGRLSKGGHGAPLPPARRPVPHARRHRLLLHLLGPCVDVQACCGRAVRGRGAARPKPGAAVPPARGRPARPSGRVWTILRP